MQDRIRKTLKGSHEAVLRLYDAHKETVRSLCYALLLEEKEADHTLVAGRIPNAATEYGILRLGPLALA